MEAQSPVKTIRVPSLQVQQPIGQFYVAVMKRDDVLRIAWSDVRRIAGEGLADYIGIERDLDDRRVEELARYARTVDASFPTSIILAIAQDDLINYDPATGVMEIRDDSEVAKIIDGQHRIAGLKPLQGTETPFDLNVTIFVDMDLEDQAMVFATINLAQTKVRKSLAYDLYEYTERRSPQKTAHNIAKLLNAREDSALYQRIKILGTATRRYQTLTQAAFVEALLILISGSIEQALRDRDLIKRGKRIPPAEELDGNRIVFRAMFDAKMDAQIAKVLWNYFDAVRQKWPTSWADVPRRGNMLPRTNGFRALMRFLPTAYLYIGGPPSLPSVEEFSRVFAPISLTDEDFNTDRYIPGSTGERALLDDLLDLSGMAST